MPNTGLYQIAGLVDLTERSHHATNATIDEMKSFGRSRVPDSGSPLRQVEWNTVSPCHGA